MTESRVPQPSALSSESSQSLQPSLMISRCQSFHASANDHSLLSSNNSYSGLIRTFWIISFFWSINAIILYDKHGSYHRYVMEKCFGNLAVTTIISMALFLSSLLVVPLVMLPEQVSKRNTIQRRILAGVSKGGCLLLISGNVVVFPLLLAQTQLSFLHVFFLVVQSFAHGMKIYSYHHHHHHHHHVVRSNKMAVPVGQDAMTDDIKGRIPMVAEKGSTSLLESTDTNSSSSAAFLQGNSIQVGNDDRAATPSHHSFALPSNRNVIDAGTSPSIDVAYKTVRNRRMDNESSDLHCTNAQSVCPERHTAFRKDTESLLRSLRFHLTHFTLFTFRPFFLHDPGYSRTSRIRWSFLLRHATQLFISAACIFVLLEQHLIPSVHSIAMLSSSSSESSSLVGSLASVPGHLLRLCIPLFLLLFYAFLLVFECLLNVLAEVVREENRHFYSDWWNSRSFDEFARRWNRPVHEFLHTYLYSTLLSYVHGRSRERLSDAITKSSHTSILASTDYSHIGVNDRHTGHVDVDSASHASSNSLPTDRGNYRASKTICAFLVFLISSIFHEIAVYALSGKKSIWFFAFQMSQLLWLWCWKSCAALKSNNGLSNLLLMTALVVGPSILLFVYVPTELALH